MDREEELSLNKHVDLFFAAITSVQLWNKNMYMFNFFTVSEET